METKQCTGCKQTLSLTTFRFIVAKDRYYSKCRPCANKVSNDNRQKRLKIDPEYKKYCYSHSVQSRKRRLDSDPEYKAKVYSKNTEETIKWIKKYPEKHAINIKNYHQTPKYKEKVAKFFKIEREKISDTYIKSIFAQEKIKFSEVPQELIELKRNQLKLYRDVKREESKRSN